MEDPVVKLLTDNKITFTSSGKDYLIKCLNPEHEDNNPSLHVDKLSGVANCFSCGWKRNLFRHFGITTRIVGVKLNALKEKLKSLKHVESLEYPKGSIPFTKVFRNISANTLKEFGAFYTHDEEKLVDRVVFPIKDINNNITAFIGRHVNLGAEPKYKVFPSHSEVGLLPPKLPSDSTSLILVEGIFDMLNLWDNGIKNVSCVFGTQTLAYNISLKLLPFKVQGVTKIYILFDGDDAGRKAAADLKPLIEKELFDVEIINLPDDMDPGNMDKEDIRQLSEMIK